MSNMSNYFDIGDEKGAVLLDASNFDIATFPMMSFLKDSLSRATKSQINLGYDEPSGSHRLKSLIALHEKNLGFQEIQKKNVVVNNGGVTGSFDNIFRYISHQTNKSEVIIPLPAYPEIPRSVHYNNLQAVYLNTVVENYFLPDAQELVDKMSRNTACVFLTSPGNPSNKFIDDNSLEFIIKGAKKRNAYVVLDAIFEEANNDVMKSNFFSFDYDKLIKIKGPSKDRPYMNDFRVGWSITNNDEISKGLSLVSEINGFCISKTVDEIVSKDMSYRVLSEKKSSDSQLYREEINYFFNKINEGLVMSENLCIESEIINNIITPDAGNLIYVQIKPDLLKKNHIFSGNQLFHHVIDAKNVAITPGDVFMNNDYSWFRASMTKDPVYFVDALKKVIGAFE